MGGMKFEYDESGAKFVYFLLSFYAMILIPCTYFYWPRKDKKKNYHAEDLSCFEPCRVKNQFLNQNEPRKRLYQNITKIILLIAWVVFFLLVYKASKIEVEHKEYDPFAILGIDREATDKEIKKRYRELSKTKHPDKGGNEEEFKELTKAYKSLTDEETKKNWIEYGNPDGPGATQFGIALPKWIVEGKNSYLVLGVYIFLLIILLPTIVGVWWYKSIKYTGDQILIKTYHMYGILISKTPSLIMKRAIMILGSSFEFEKSYNPEIIERPTDNTEIPQLMKDLPDLQEKIREIPFCYPYSIKARALIHAHLSRLNLNSNTLQRDKNLIIKKCPFLINEMINIVAGITLAMSNEPNRGHHPPTLETLENLMRLSQMIVQALWDKNRKGSLLQLPHINESNLKHFVNKKKNIQNIKQFVSMKDIDRRSILRNLADEQYEDILRVCKSYPYIEMKTKVNVIDDEDDRVISVNALVTVIVNLERHSLEKLFDNEEKELPNDTSNAAEEETEEKEKHATIAAIAAASPNKNGKKETKNSTKEKKETKEAKDTKNTKDTKETPKEEQNNITENEEEKKNEYDSQEDFFEKFQQMQKKKEKLETKDKTSHRVYCPFFSDVKQECWWLYITDKKKNQIACTPVYICSLKQFEEIEMKFMAPPKPGSYSYSVVLRSDSYVNDFDIVQTIKIHVEPAKEIQEHPQWNFLDEEEKENEKGSMNEDEYTTESEEE